MNNSKQSKLTSNEHQSVPQTGSTTRRASKKASSAKLKAVTSAGSGKIGKIIAMLRRPKGATIADISKATDWQPHSVGGAISGAIKKKLGLKVTSEKTGTVRLYRIAAKPAG